MNVILQHTPVFPVEQTPTLDWLAPVKEYLTRSGRQSWRAYTDGSWKPPPLSLTSLFATTAPGSVAGAGVVLSPGRIGIRHRIVALKLRTGPAWDVRMHI